MEDGNVMINVIYEDNHLLVAEKPINVPVQADNSGDMDFLSMLKDYVKKKYNKPGNVYLGLVHRLDRPVGGVMVFAKTSKAAARLSKQVRENKLKKVYYAVVCGKAQKSSVLIHYLSKDRNNNITKVSDDGKYSELSYLLASYKDNLSLVKIFLKTGRSHQIRVQFADRNLPLYGDQKYNPNTPKDQIALFASELSFVHPVTKEEMYFRLDIPDRYPFNLFK